MAKKSCHQKKRKILSRKQGECQHQHQHRFSSSTVAEKGRVVVYTADKKRCSYPIAYLNNYIFRKLPRMAAEEFGLPRDGPITIPCEAVFMDYLISLIPRRATKGIEKALLVSIFGCNFSSCASHQLESSQNQLIYCFSPIRVCKCK